MSNSAQNGKDKTSGMEPSEAELLERRDRLTRLLDERRVAEEHEAQPKSGGSSGYGQAVKLSSEFIAGIVVGGGMGWLVDDWLGTTPFGLIVFLLIGFAAGVLNVLRAAGRVAEPEARVPTAKERDDKSK
ncbi:AtpZ/AtpI family protein [Roseibium sp. RKSG952]|uniref:AtpZ/AtpI family protein n=1 Tax=Roseibium sp. RKSG952 TaxID=2529384 RepID=UPI0012BD5350|nr:AtpZ/AtpI family protein [Roseibium sp. RKSG952]MTH96024.1 ATP F0F1 synthase subunit I [Roseibium sp. RKSG952]